MLGAERRQNTNIMAELSLISVKETQYLPVKLTEEEHLDRSRALAGLNQRRTQTESEKSEVTKRFGDMIKGLGVQIDDLSKVVAEGEEMRPVTCRKEYHQPKTGECRIVRTDTEEVVEVRAMFRHEIEQANAIRQFKLDFEDDNGVTDEGDETPILYLEPGQN